MTSNSKDNFHSNTAISPGEVLAEELEAREMTHFELASSLGYTADVVEGIIAGESPVTRETALALEKTLGSKASVWLNLESNYRESKAEIEGDALP